MVRKGFAPKELGVVFGVIGLPLLLYFMCPCSWLFRGCDSSSEKENPGLKGVLIGKWVKKTDTTISLEFTEKSVEYHYLGHRVGKYEIKGEKILLTDTDNDLMTYVLEILSDGEIMLRPEKRNFGSDFHELDGHWQRASTSVLPPPPSISKGKSNSDLDFTGLRGVLSGKWVMKQSSTEGQTLEFTSGKTAFLKRSGFEKVAKYNLSEGVLTFTTEWDGIRRSEAKMKPTPKSQAPNEFVYEVEFLSDIEISLRLERRGEGFDWFQLAGHWQRISLPSGMEKASVEKGPIADAKSQVRKIEIKLIKIEAILESALTDRDELAGKLRSTGVKTTADLKNNIRGKRVADNLVKIAGEIDGLERQLASIDTELLKAKSIVRRMEREQAGLSEEEMRMLAQQLREVEERTDGIRATPANAIDIDEAVEKALKAEGRPKKNK